MRGIAILAIMLHNYTHWLGPMVKENEYTFTEHNVRRLMVELAHPSWEIFAHLLSFFGHYGVSVFLFLSAYGLVMKYEDPHSTNKGGNMEGALDFIWKHYKKLFLMMIVGYSAFVLVDYMTAGPRHYTFWNVVGQLGMFSNLYADPDHAIWPGPYWYFGLMVQVYVVYRLLLYQRIKGLDWALLLITLFAQVFFEPEGMALNWYNYNVFGALPEFIFGLMITRMGRTWEFPRAYYIAGVIVCSFLIMLLSLNYYTWMLVPFIVCIGTLCVVKALPDTILNPMAWVGSISAAMFVCHPIARKVLIPISRRGDIYAGLLLYLVAAIMLSILFKKFIDRKVNS